MYVIQYLDKIDNLGIDLIPRTTTESLRHFNLYGISGKQGQASTQG